MLHYSYSHQVRRPYNIYMYDPNITRQSNEMHMDRPLAEIQRDILHVLSLVMDILRTAPKSARTPSEKDAESSEYDIYDREMFDAEKFADLCVDQPPFEEWACRPRVVQEREERNAIRRLMYWRVDDATAKLESPLSDPFLSVIGT
jgi:hypothetical protein